MQYLDLGHQLDNTRNMAEIRIRSITGPLRHPAVLTLLLALLSKANAMGLIRQESVESLDAATLGHVLDSLQDSGLLRVDRSRIQALLEPGRSGAPEPSAIAALRTAIQAIEESPYPQHEWHAMRAIFGEESLAQLLGVSLSSLRRYAALERDTPLDVADRLHWLAMTVADLAGSYNDFGIRRWFERPRAQLSGKTPRDLLGADWDSATDSAERVRRLAQALSASGAT